LVIGLLDSEGIEMCPNVHRVLPKRVVSLFQHLKDLVDLEVTIRVIGGGVVTPLSAVRLCRRKVLPKGP
jgi:hypothetical protein